MESWREKFQTAERLARDGEQKRARQIYTEAVTQLQQACADEPDRADFVQILARALLQAGQKSAALELLYKANARLPGNRALDADLARLCFDLEDYAGAIDVYRRILKFEPSDRLACEGLVQALMHLGRFDEALAVLNDALNKNPHDFRLLHFKANALLTGRDYDAAAALFQSLCKETGNTSACFNLGICHIKLKQFTQAALIFAQLESAPEHAVEASYYGALVTLLAGDVSEALRGFETVLKQNPSHINSLWYRAHCLRELGEDNAAKPFLDAEGLVHCAFPLEDLKQRERTAYLNVLSEFARDYPYQRWEPAGKTTRGGSQTFNLLKRGDGLMLQFERLVRDTVESALAGSAWSAEHSLIVHRPTRFKLELWATILKSGGHQQPHIHPGGWLSGVFYCSVPDNINNEAGWIEFGLPPYETRTRYEPWTTRIQPQPGMIVLFPSWLPHNTVPFKSAQTRISLAFDCVPAVAADGER